MPETGVQLQPDDKILTRKEIKTLGEMFVTAGVNKIRLTGGEVSGFILLFSFFFFFLDLFVSCLLVISLPTTHHLYVNSLLLEKTC